MKPKMPNHQAAYGKGHGVEAKGEKYSGGAGMASLKSTVKRTGDPAFHHKNSAHYNPGDHKIEGHCGA